MRHVTECSVTGAELAVRRLRTLGDALDRFHSAGLDDDHALVVLAVAADRNSHPDDLDPILDDPAAVTSIVDELVGANVLRWDRIGRLQLSGTNPFRSSW